MAFFAVSLILLLYRGNGVGDMYFYYTGEKITCMVNLADENRYVSCYLHRWLYIPELCIFVSSIAFIR